MTLGVMEILMKSDEAKDVKTGLLTPQTSKACKRGLEK